MKPKYYLAKTLIGSDKTYLPLLENIVWMTKMTDPEKDNLESFLIVDDESIEMMKLTSRKDDGSYYDFVLSTGVELITINQLIDRVIEDPKIKEDAHFVYEKLRFAVKVNFLELDPETNFELLPVSLQADFAKALFIRGFANQNFNSVNICEDLDVMHDKPSSLPDNPQDFLKGSDLGLNRIISYYQKHGELGVLEFLTKEDRQLISANQEMRQMWESYKNCLESGKTHNVFTTNEVVSKIRDDYGNNIPQGVNVFIGSEYMAARSKALPIKASMAESKESLEEFFEVIEKQIVPQAIQRGSRRGVESLNNYLQRNRKWFVDTRVSSLYGWWSSEHPTAITVDPDEFGICGRYDIQKWKYLSSSEEIKHYSPNIKAIEEVLHPWTPIIRGFLDAVEKKRDASSNEADSTSKISEISISHEGLVDDSRPQLFEKADLQHPHQKTFPRTEILPPIQANSASGQFGNPLGLVVGVLLALPVVRFVVNKFTAPSEEIKKARAKKLDQPLSKEVYENTK